MRPALALCVLIGTGCAASAPAPSSPPTPAPARRPPLVRIAPDPAEIELPSIDGLSETGRLALKVLLETTEFTSDAVSDGGEVPLQVEAFRLLFREEPAATGAAFLYLASQGTRAGKLFGVCGLWFTDPEAFELECSWMAREPEDETVMMFEGCIRGERPLAGIVRCKDGNPVVRLKDRSQTVRQWFAETGTESAHFDIEGGAWPSILRGRAPGEP